MKKLEEDQNPHYNLNYSTQNNLESIQNPIQYQQTIIPQTYQTQQVQVKQFSQPSSRPPENEHIDLQDAFGSLIPQNDGDGET